jgi:hypothetical protein
MGEICSWEFGLTVVFEDCDITVWAEKGEVLELLYTQVDQFVVFEYTTHRLPSGHSLISFTLLYILHGCKILVAFAQQRKNEIYHFSVKSNCKMLVSRKLR